MGVLPECFLEISDVRSEINSDNYEINSDHNIGVNCDNNCNKIHSILNREKNNCLSLTVLVQYMVGVHVHIASGRARRHLQTSGRYQKPMPRMLSSYTNNAYDVRMNFQI